jgi:hypothetical protein
VKYDIQFLFEILKKSSKILGVNEVIFLGCPDQSIKDTTAFRKEMVRQIRIFNPEIVVISNPYRDLLAGTIRKFTGLKILSF